MQDLFKVFQTDVKCNIYLKVYQTVVKCICFSPVEVNNICRSFQ